MIINNTDTDFFILHGEDDSGDARMLEVILEKVGYQGGYHHLVLGQEVVEWMTDIHKPLPGLLLLDIGLPGIDGKEILQLLRKEPRTLGVPIIMMSGSKSLRDYQECIAMGANAYIQKTADLDSLAPICQCFIDGWKRLSSQVFF